MDRAASLLGRSVRGVVIEDAVLDREHRVVRVDRAAGERGEIGVELAVADGDAARHAVDIETASSGAASILQHQAVDRDRAVDVGERERRSEVLRVHRDGAGVVSDDRQRLARLDDL